MNNTQDSVLHSLANPSQVIQQPYPIWILDQVIPEPMVDEICALPWQAPDLHGVSGTREVNNASRKYFDRDSQQQFPASKALCEAFQSRPVTQSIEQRFSTTLLNSFLRIEYAQDTNDFWLGPHTDIGVKLFTMLLYLSDDPQHRSLGTDYYKDKQTHAGTVPFARNRAMVFIPADNTWHGFEKRTISGIRKSLVINFVTEDWRAREQLAFPEQAISY